MAFSATATLLALLLVVLGGVSSEPRRSLEGVLREFDSLEEKALALEASKVPIHFEVKKQADSGKKHVELYYYDESGERKKLAELLPLDLSAFIEHGLARKQGDELDVHFARVSPFVKAVIRPKGAEVGVQYNMWIHDAGGIGFVRLSEAREIEGGRASDIDFPQAHIREHKLYYVRVPINLFPELDGEALQAKAGLDPLRGYTLNTCSRTKAFGAASSMTDYFSCLVMNFGSGERARALATPIEDDSDDEVHFIEPARKMAEVVVREQDPSSFAVDPKLATDSNVQYVVWVDLLQPPMLFYLMDPKLVHGMDPKLFHRMEPQFVEKHGQLVGVQRKKGLRAKFSQMVTGRKPTKKPNQEEVELVCEKDGKKNGKKNRVTFPLRLCPEGQFPLPYCLRTDEAIGEQPNGLGVTYAYELDGN